MTTPTETEQDGTVTVAVHQGIATVTFFHPKRNALPATILRQLAETPRHSFARNTCSTTWIQTRLAAACSRNFR